MQHLRYVSGFSGRGFGFRRVLRSLGLLMSGVRTRDYGFRVRVLDFSSGLRVWGLELWLEGKIFRVCRLVFHSPTP